MCQSAFQINWLIAFLTAIIIGALLYCFVPKMNRGLMILIPLITLLLVGYCCRAYMEACKCTKDCDCGCSEKSGKKASILPNDVMTKEPYVDFYKN